MSSEAFEQYAATIEEDDFEDDVRNLSSSLHQLVGARRDTIKKLRASAEYLDSIWVRYVTQLLREKEPTREGNNHHFNIMGILTFHQHMPFYPK